MLFKDRLVHLTDHFFNLVYPSLCYSCNEPLVSTERIICARCKLDLPVIENPVITQRLNDALSDISPHYLSSFLYYRKGNITQKLLYSFKYEGNEKLGRQLGRWFGEFLLSKFDTNAIDLIVPVPLHKNKLIRRGFNQSAVLAKGVSDMTGVSCATHLVKRVSKNKSQTRKSRFKRIMDVKEIFAVPNPSLLENRHVLLIDDVITTGSTLSACAQKMLSAGIKKISIATLAAAQ